MDTSDGCFVWYELMTTNVECAKAFYTNVVGWGTQDASSPIMDYILFTAGGVSVSGLMGMPEDARKRAAKPSWIGYVGANDVDAAADRVKRLGGAVHVPPTEIPNVSRFSVVSDPQMASLGLLKWLKSGQDKSAEVDAPGRVGWYELFATDRERAFDFYRELFGWQEADAHEIGARNAYQLFSSRGRTIGGMVAKPLTAPAPFWLFYFNVDEIDEAAKRVRAGGGEILRGLMKVPGGSWTLHCADPQGASFALVGKRIQDGVERDPAHEVGWSTEWRGLSLKGRLLTVRTPPRS
jgi:predicted enzyme related to lactoylglutathione lyase